MSVIKMMENNIMTQKSLSFAVRIVNLRKYLVQEKKEYDISKQIVRSGTSIGANINEADCAQSHADFVSKLHIALKEARETEYWLRLLALTSYITEDARNSLLADCHELQKILIAAINTAKSK